MSRSSCLSLRRAGSADAAWLVAYFLLGVAACWWRDPASLPFTLDNRHYYFVAERAASGVPPHVSHFDSKHQLGALVSALGIRAARALGADDVAGARVASILVAAGAVALAFAAGRAVGASRLAGHVAALVVLGDEGFLTMAAMGARPKVFLVGFELAVTLALARRRPATAGTAAALAFLCWQPAALVGLAALPVLWAGGENARTRARALARFAVGGLAPVVLYHALFLAAGALREELDQAYRFPALFMAGAESDAGQRALGFFRLLAGPSLRSAVPLLFAATLIAAAVAALRAPRRAAGRAAAEPGLAHALVAGGATLAFSLTDYQTYVDGFFALPFAAVLLGWGSAWAVGHLARGRAGRHRALAAAAVALFALRAVLQPPVHALGPQLADQRALARQVGAILASGRSVWAVGCTHLLALQRVDNHVPYGFFFRGMEGYLADRYGADGYRPLRDGRMPDVILVSGSVPPDVRGWLVREYREATAPAFARQGVHVWTRRGEPLPSPLSPRTRAP